jgi:hypothetical protein
MMPPSLPRGRPNIRIRKRIPRVVIADYFLELSSILDCLVQPRRPQEIQLRIPSGTCHFSGGVCPLYSLSLSLILMLG